MQQHIIVEEAKNLIQQLEDSRKKIEHISGEHAFVKALLLEKNRKILEQQEKIEGLTRLLAMADKMLSEMKEKVRVNENKTNLLSEKLKSAAEGQNSGLEEIKKIIELRNEQISKLVQEKNLMQNKINLAVDAYSKQKKQLNSAKILLQDPAGKKAAEADRKKIDELTRLLVMADKMLSDMREKLYNKEEKTTRLSEKLSTIADGQNKTLEEMKNAIESRDEHIKKLLRERTLMQNRVNIIVDAYSKTKKQLGESIERLRAAQQNNASEEEKKKIEEMKKIIERKEAEIGNVSKIFSESRGRIKNLEEENQKIAVEYAHEKEVLQRMIVKREEEIKKLREIAKETGPKPVLQKKGPVKINVPKTFDPLERKELASMIKIALANGDSIERIRESLVNVGYDKDKVDSIIS